MKTMTNEVKQKIREAIKNKEDISELIRYYSIKGEDLSGAVIKDFNREGQDCTGVNLSRCIIGESKKLTRMSNSIFTNANFYHTKFLGRVKANHIIALNANFNRAYMPFMEYQYADLRGSSFCDMTIKVGNVSGYKAKFSKETLEQMFKHWLSND